ncbi:hypothetical protein Rumeso_00721 [Rubellimicrobium mesophilum DSM 19309]|uniref:Extensin-like C-terminal domain-containing protein n=1 Tax=Rubellimicrobium mesophilum DSM 19309 TaxID=442562 RepID=A0A017HTD2_9RHOB|nr:extensin family protein [Rubellimicrobium mesophilum]EYD77555.1 hypothetical protein Rumeso_00721 [Rubellimicrobium mesophilum DSM 19309]
MKADAAALLALGLLPGLAWAEAPETSPRPEVRAIAEPPGRPEARPTGGAALAIELHPDGSPLAQDVAPTLPTVRPADPLPSPGAERLPTVMREAPLLEDDPPPPRLEGPRAIVRAEELMTEPPPVPVTVGGWEGAPPPIRPAAEPPPSVLPVPGRPRSRPQAPQDPQPLPPSEPDAPPAYAPGARPDVLPEGLGYSPLAVARAVLPASRPSGIVERAEQRRAELVRGQVCGDPAIQGEVIAAIHAGGGCGVEEPVLVRSVDGVRLSEPATMDCATAQALLDWTRDGARPAVGSRGGGLAELEVMGSYTCRPRNNQAGARLSEHGKGRAIDIGAAVLADGSTLSVLRDWPDPALRQMREAACGTFSTVLGPGDPFHDDHLHLDTARGRGAYCR